MIAIETRKAQLEARLAELRARIARIEDELEQPVSERFAEQATEREEDEVLEDLGAAGRARGPDDRGRARPHRQRQLRHLRPLRRPDRRGAARRAAATPMCATAPSGRSPADAGSGKRVQPRRTGR